MSTTQILGKRAISGRALTQVSVMVRGLKPRLIIVIISFLSLAIGASSYLHLRLEYNQFVDMAREQLSEMVEVIERSIQSSMQAGKSEEVRKIITQVGMLSGLERVRIFTKTGKIVLSSKSDEVGSQISAEEMKKFHSQQFSAVFNSENFDKPLFYVLKPIINRPVCFRCHGNNPNQINGVLEVQVSMERIHGRLAKNRRVMVTSTVITLLLLVVAIIIVLTRLVNKPIEKLILTMREATRGDLTVRHDLDDTSEFEELGRNFNTMIIRLEAAHRDLREMHADQLERADRMATLGELAAGIAHEIKNPIAGISGAMQILKDDIVSPDEKREIIEEIVKQIGRINRDVQDLLCYAKPGKLKLAPKDIVMLIKQAIFLVKEPAVLQNVKVEFDDSLNLPEIMLDEKKIQQVMVNLALNALQAMPGGGILTITPTLKDEFLEIEFRDTGSGISSEIMGRIFTPFFTTRMTGTGLGLSICKKMLEEHNGKIEVRSEIGKGSSFIVILPVTSREELGYTRG